jgi:hypothetical protein
MRNVVPAFKEPVSIREARALINSAQSCGREDLAREGRELIDKVTRGLITERAARERLIDLREFFGG